MAARLQEIYNKEIRKSLKEQFGYKSDMQIPRLEKISVNMGVGEGATDNKVIDFAVADLTAITGQKPFVAHARKAEATFKLREGVAIGCKVTLRRQRMYEFLDRLVNIAMPRIRDFRGISGKSFDGRGNYTVGLKEHMVFPELAARESSQNFGIEIVIATSAADDESGYRLLKKFGFPFND